MPFGLDPERVVVQIERSSLDDQARRRSLVVWKGQESLDLCVERTSSPFTGTRREYSASGWDSVFASQNRHRDLSFKMKQVGLGERSSLKDNGGLVVRQVKETCRST